MSDALEAGYRRILMTLPRQYWAEHAEEMLGVLMDGAKPGQRRPKAREVLSVATLAVRLRFAVGDQGESGRLVGDIMRRAVAAYLIFWFGLEAQLVGFGERSGYAFGPVTVHAGIVVSLVLGWSMLGRALCLAYGGLLLHHEQLWSNWERAGIGDGIRILIPFLALAAAVVVFHRRAPRLPGTAWWLTVWVGITVAFWLRGKSIRHMYALDIWNTPALTAIICAAAVVFALWHAKNSPLWPAALALASLPLLTYIQFFFRAPDSMMHMTRNELYLDVVIGADLLLMCTALASSLFWYYQRRLLTTGREAA